MRTFGFWVGGRETIPKYQLIDLRRILDMGTFSRNVMHDLRVMSEVFLSAICRYTETLLAHRYSLANHNADHHQSSGSTMQSPPSSQHFWVSHPALSISSALR